MAYTEKRKEKIFQRIIDELINDGKAIRDILQESWSPSPSTFFQWLEDDEAKTKQYARAYKAKAEVLFDEMMHIAFTPEIGEITKMIQRGNKKEMEKTRADMIAHRTLKVNTIKWALSKMEPKKYGDKVDITTDGEKVNTSIPLVMEDGRTYEDLKNELRPEEEE